jgi:hypothetical protein
MMNRRNWLRTLGIGSAALITGAEGRSLVARASTHQGHVHAAIRGPLASATVSFGQWPVGTLTAPIDRHEVANAPEAPNVHLIVPQTATIRAGGAVNFIVAGFHQIVVYAPGTKPQDIDTSVQIPVVPGVGLIDDPTNRLYRGVNPLTVPQDRVEVVRFGERGLYFVICAVSVHFIGDSMFGWVNVLP